MDSGEMSDEEKTDLYRDTPVRLLGYANEVGEAFREIVGARLVMLSYVIASAYAVADTIDKSMEMYLKSHDRNDRLKRTVFSATDTLLWQSLASVVIPGYTINRICAGTASLLKKKSAFPSNVQKWIVPVVGLWSIPFVMGPIDNVSDFILDETFRKMTPKE